eukprot:9751578-Lingulodinium_polyedra.AAC.1
MAWHGMPRQDRTGQDRTGHDIYKDKVKKLCCLLLAQNLIANDRNFDFLSDNANSVDRALRGTRLQPGAGAAVAA